MRVSQSWGKTITTYIDKKTGNKVVSEKGSRQDQTDFVRVVKTKVWDMSLVNFFIAGSNRKGNVSEDNVRYVMGYNIGWRESWRW